MSTRSYSLVRGAWLVAGLTLVGCGDDVPDVDDFTRYVPPVEAGAAQDAGSTADSGFFWDSGWDVDASVIDEDADTEDDDAGEEGDLDAGDAASGDDAGDASSSDAGLDGSAGDGGSSDAAVSDAGLDGSAGDGGTSDAAVGDAGLDGSVSDASTSDASVGDASTSDGSVSDGSVSDASTDAQVDGGTPNFPRPGEAVNVAVGGPYTVATYSTGLENNEYSAVRAYYPTNARAPFAAVVFAPDTLLTQEDYSWYGNMLASHGIVAVTFTPTNTGSNATARATDITAALTELRAEQTRQGSPLVGKLDLTRLGVMGHGYGGAAALRVANAQGTALRAVVPLQSWETGVTFPNVKASSLFLAAEDDLAAAVSTNAYAHYTSIPAPPRKIFGELDSAGHLVSTDFSVAAERTLQTRHVLSFLKIHLEDDTRYETYVTGLEHDKDASRFSRYLKAP